MQDRALAAVERHKVHLIVGHTHAFDPNVRVMRAIIANGELNGKAIADHSSQLPWSATARVANRNRNTCIIVTGIDRVCTSRTVVASEPTARNTEPSSR